MELAGPLSRKGYGGSRSSGVFEPHLLEYLRNAVSDGGSRHKREIYYAERHTEALRRFAGDQLTDARYFERGLLDCFAERFKIRSVYLFERALNDARAAYAHVDSPS